jgi:hypothetical protein
MAVRIATRSALMALAVVLNCSAAPRADVEVTPADAPLRALTLHARVIATGLPGAHGTR